MGRAKGEAIAEIREKMQAMMMDKVSVVRDATGMNEAQESLRELRDAFNHAAIQDKSAIYNTDLTEAMELGYMLDCADTIVAGASGGLLLTKKPVSITRFEPKERKY